MADEPTDSTRVPPGDTAETQDPLRIEDLERILDEKLKRIEGALDEKLQRALAEKLRGLNRKANFNIATVLTVVGMLFFQFNRIDDRFLDLTRQSYELQAQFIELQHKVTSENATKINLWGVVNALEVLERGGRLSPDWRNPIVGPQGSLQPFDSWPIDPRGRPIEHHPARANDGSMAIRVLGSDQDLGQSYDILALAEGVVAHKREYKNDVEKQFWTVAVDHSNGNRTIYKRLSKVIVEEDSLVRKNQKIAEAIPTSELCFIVAVLEAGKKDYTYPEPGRILPEIPSPN